MSLRPVTTSHVCKVVEGGGGGQEQCSLVQLTFPCGTIWVISNFAKVGGGREEPGAVTLSATVPVLLATIYTTT